MNILVDDLTSPEIAEFLEEHIQEMRAITPLESKHALDLDGLRKPEITFWSVYDDDRLIGTGAIKVLGDGHAEVKSMRTAADRRGTGVASLMLEHIFTEAKALGVARLSLETGSTAPFESARKLYEKFGFEYCGPFADYKLDPYSVFMTKAL